MNLLIFLVGLVGLLNDNTIMKIKKQKKERIKFICSECGKIHYRIRRLYYEDKNLYCTFCQEPTLIEITKTTNLP